MTHHPDSPSTNMSFEKKIEKMLTHWIKHNNEHADNYSNWSTQANGNHLDSIAELLDQAADMTRQTNHLFETALSTLNGS